MKRAVLVPRENDLVRFTVQIVDADVGLDPATGRIDRSKVQVDKIQQVCTRFVTDSYTRFDPVYSFSLLKRFTSHIESTSSANQIGGAHTSLDSDLLQGMRVARVASSSSEMPVSDASNYLVVKS